MPRSRYRRRAPHRKVGRVPALAPVPLVVRVTGRAHAREFPQTKGRSIEPGRGFMDESRSLTRKEPVDVLVYRTRVPAHLWYNPHERAALIARMESEDRCPIGYDES